MKQIIELNGIKYKKINEEKSKDEEIKGYTAIAMIFIFSFLLIWVCFFLQKWISAIICLMITYLCGSVAFDGFTDIKKRIDAQKSTTPRKKRG